MDDWKFQSKGGKKKMITISTRETKLQNRFAFFGDEEEEDGSCIVEDEDVKNADAKEKNADTSNVKSKDVKSKAVLRLKVRNESLSLTKKAKCKTKTKPKSQKIVTRKKMMSISLAYVRNKFSIFGFMNLRIYEGLFEEISVKI